MSYWTTTLLWHLQPNHYEALNAWFYTPQGVRVGHAFAAELNALSEPLVGKKLLQLGHCGDNFWLNQLRFRQKWLISPCLTLINSTVFGAFNYLPFARDSIDCIIAPLTLEAVEDDNNLLDELDRVLKPMGTIVFFGINPWSFWGAALRWGRLSCFAHSTATISSSLALKRAMRQRAYRQSALTNFYYIPPFVNEKWIKHLEFLNEMGKMLWPYPAGFYCLVMQKMTICQPNLILNSNEESFHFAQA